MSNSAGTGSRIRTEDLGHFCGGRFGDGNSDCLHFSTSSAIHALPASICPNEAQAVVTFMATAAVCICQVDSYADTFSQCKNRLHMAHSHLRGGLFAESQLPPTLMAFPFHSEVLSSQSPYRTPRAERLRDLVIPDPNTSTSDIPQRCPSLNPP
jgi:hypothetical protein